MIKRARFAFCLLLAVFFVQVAGAARSRVEIGKKVNKGGADDAVLAEFASWPRDKVFLKVGDEILLWGSVYDYIGLVLKTKPLALPSGTTWADVEKAKRFNERKLAVGLAKRYMGGALMAQLARKANVDISKAKLTATGIVERLVASFPDEFRGEARSGFAQPGSYISSCVTNTLLGDAYVESLIRPTVSVTETEIAGAIAARKAEIAKVIDVNAKKKAKMVEILADLRTGTNTFEHAAEQWSECVSSDQEGYWGAFGEESSSLLPEIKSVAFSLPTNVLSDVVETPRSYHILKVLAEPPAEVAASEDAEDLSDFEDGEKVVHLSHIMFEKVPVPPVLDERSARTFLVDGKIAAQLNDLKCAALTNLDIQCAFPLKLKKGEQK